jgi:ketosteroid isomerase-like protein
MHNHEALIQQFYTAFQQGDYATMQRAYHDEATFTDPAFRNLTSVEVGAMWQMLMTSGSDLKISFNRVNANDTKGSCHWEATYTFSGTGRKVHNVVDAEFEFKDGKILHHRDHFNFWRWSRMALGTPGILLGWSPILMNKVRKTARARLNAFMKKIPNKGFSVTK